MNKLIFTFLFGLTLSTCFGQNYYQVTFPNDTTVLGCGAQIDTIWPQITNFGGCNFNAGVSVTDQVFTTTNGGACSMIYRKFHIIWWCNYDPNTNITTTIPNPTNTTQGPTAFGNPQNRGDLQYTQIIKLLDNDGPQFLNCPVGPVTACDYTSNDPNQWNVNHMDACEAPVKLETAVTDACSGSNLTISYKLFLDTDNNGSMETVINSNNLGAWPLITQVVNDTLKARINFAPNIELPYGRHKIQWLAKDHCGHQTYCQYEFVVKDCAPPTIICLHGISVNLMPGGMITIPEADLLQYTYDNCTPALQIKTGVRLAGTGTGFPLNQHEVNLTCNQLGLQQVQVWAQDAVGNADYCTATVNVQDHIGACGTTNRIGQLKTTAHMPLANVPVSVKLSGSNDQWNTTTDSDGRFAFQEVPFCGLQFSAQPGAPYVQGINTLDALTLARHIQGLQQITDPYQIIASDLNLDKKLDQADLTLMTNMILQNQTPSWMLFQESFVPAIDPLQSVLPGAITQVGCNQDSIMLRMVRKGDSDGSWATGFTRGSVQGNAALFSVADRIFTEGETFDIEVFTPDLDGIPAFQFALNLDPAFLQIASFMPDLVATAGTYLQESKGSLACAWFEPSLQGPVAAKGMRVRAFTITVTAKQAGKLSDILKLSDAQLPSAAYALDNQTLPVELAFIDMQRANTDGLGVSATPTLQRIVQR